jgi:hypothetical protein
VLPPTAAAATWTPQNRRLFITAGSDRAARRKVAPERLDPYDSENSANEQDHERQLRLFPAQCSDLLHDEFEIAAGERPVKPRRAIGS